MKTLFKLALLFIPLLALFGIHSIQSRTPITQQGLVSPTPTYDPFAAPPLPPNPTEYELGRNLYWNWCMPCHGDKGQGLTDEFRGMWVPDHQNCWARGCHTGRRDDTGFPIPTVVPALMNDVHLAGFSSLQDLADFLKATHPPQSPGVLKDDEYHAIAFFVLAMNGRLPANISPTVSPVPIATETLIPSDEPVASPYLLPVNILVILTALVVTAFVLIRRIHHQRKHIST